ncbi:lytic polysaccharide monooxygenase [Providencia sp. Me31A]|uniref:lytic polysaccharide monooxygenase n=1 Tax=Providencia sp. Me31A TaxID=3392637 RepID=UPI003D265DF6
MKKLLLGSLLLCSSFSVWSHGYVKFPESRSYLCQQKANTGCGQIQYEPQSLEASKGFPQAGPDDGKIASAGHFKFRELDEQTTTRWKHVQLDATKIAFKWFFTAPHKTTKWEYFVTKTDWDPNAPLTRQQFDLTPFCEVNGFNKKPPVEVEHTCEISSDRKGYHVILSVWTIFDTGNAFYQVIDTDLR